MVRTDYGYVFDYWSEFVNHVATGHSDMDPKERSSRKTARDFNHVVSFDEAVKLAQDGWVWGEAKARNLSDNMFAKLSKTIERWDLSYDMQGAALDVGRFLHNDPECFQNFEPTYVEGPGHRLVHIVFNCSVSAGIARDVIIARGALTAALTQLLEYAGHSVQIDVVSGITGHRAKSNRFSNTFNDFELWVRVKDYGQPLDLSVVIFALAHPAMLRCLEFSFLETLSDGMRKMLNVTRHGGYGTPAEIDRERRGDIYIHSGHLHKVQWLNEHTARNWIVDELKKQGVDIKDDDLYLYV